MVKPYKAAPLRRSARINLRVPVTLTGKYPDGKSFTENTHILTISKFGAKLVSRLPLKMGMAVKVQPRNGNQSAIFRIIWLGQENTPRAGEVGIEYVKVSNLLGVTFPE